MIQQVVHAPHRSPVPRHPAPPGATGRLTGSRRGASSCPPGFVRR